MSDLTIPPDRPPVQVPPADTPGVQGLLTLAVAVVVVAGLYLGREVMIPIILAVLLSFLLAPLVNVLRRMHLGRGIPCCWPSCWPSVSFWRSRR